MNNADWLPLAAPGAATLPSLPLASANLSNAFHTRLRQCSSHAADNRFEWTFQFQAQAAPTGVELQGENISLLLQANSDQNHASDALAWWNFEGDSRLLGWSITYDTLLQQLQELFSTDLQVTRIAPSERPSALQHHLRWQATGATERFFGVMSLCDEGLAHLLEKVTWHPVHTPTLRTRLFTPLRLEASLGHFNLSELHAINPGDLLLTGWHSLATTAIRVLPDQGRQGWIGAIDHNHLVIQTHSIDIPSWEPAVTMESNPDSPAEPDSPRTFSLNALQLELTVQLGQQQFSLAELEQLQPGYVITLPQTVSDNRLMLMVNNQPIGRGELVTLGNQLGVRVVEWNSNGL